MKASALMNRLMELIDEVGDMDVKVDSGYALTDIEVVGETVEEDDCICIWTL